MDTLELGRVLRRVARARGHPLDILGMDACLMSSLEVAYQARDHVRYLVASEGVEPDTGWPYSKLLQRLSECPQQPTDELAGSIVATYVQSCRSGSAPGPATQSAVDLSRIDHLTGALDRLAGALTDAMPEAASDIFAAQKASMRFQHDTLWDISDFCLKLEQVSASRPIRTAARRVRSALQPGPGRFVVAHDHAGAPYETCGGVSIYLPPHSTPISEHYTKLDFAREHRWLPMLRAYHQADPRSLHGAGGATAPRRPKRRAAGTAGRAEGLGPPKEGKMPEEKGYVYIFTAEGPLQAAPSRSVRGIRDVAETARERGVKAAIATVQANMQSFLEGLGKIIEACPRDIGGLALDEIEVHAQIDGKGNVGIAGLLGAEVAAQSGIKFVLRKQRGG
jgi:hypothetical protein